MPGSNTTIVYSLSGHSHWRPGLAVIGSGGGGLVGIGVVPRIGRCGSRWREKRTYPVYGQTLYRKYPIILGIAICYDAGMSDAEDEERALRINLMQTQIELYKAQLRWEPWKALAAMAAAAAVFAGSVLALSNWLHPPGSQSNIAPQVIFQPGSIVVQPAPPVK
jgi:hypothetical protein